MAQGLCIFSSPCAQEWAPSLVGCLFVVDYEQDFDMKAGVSTHVQTRFATQCNGAAVGRKRKMQMKNRHM